MSKSKKQKNTSSHTNENLAGDVLNAFKHNAGKLLNYRQVSALVDVDDEPRRLEVIKIMEVLKKQGLLSEKEPGKFQYKEQENYLSGVIDFTSAGAAYVSVSLKEDDIFIPKGKTKDALQGDTVKVLVTENWGKKKEGVVAGVIERKRKDYVGIAQVNGKTIFVVPDGNKIHVDFFIPQGKSKGVKDGQKVLLNLVSWNPAETNPTGEITEILGYPGAHTTEMHAIMAEYGLPEHFRSFQKPQRNKVFLPADEENIQNY